MKKSLVAPMLLALLAYPAVAQDANAQSAAFTMALCASSDSTPN